MKLIRYSFLFLVVIFVIADCLPNKRGVRRGSEDLGFGTSEEELDSPVKRDSDEDDDDDSGDESSEEEDVDKRAPMLFKRFPFKARTGPGGRAAEKRTLTKREPSSCTPKYKNAPAPSTMCEYEDGAGIRDLGVNARDKQMILDLHNKLRRDVKPQASDMQKTYWDDEIAVIAQKWAATCIPAHDEGWNRRVPGYHIGIGQNWAGGFPGWKEAIMAWHSEVKDFTYGAENDLHLVGHYTQIEQSVASRIGCGYAYCPESTMPQNYVCNYVYGQSDINKPYTQGRPCGQCPGKCRDGLCDCGGKICMNGGSLDVATCTCKCSETAKTSGDMCENLECGGQDEWYCGEAPYDGEACKKFSTFPSMCPILCGVCKNNCPHIPSGYCENDSKLGPDCKCVCSEGFTGDKCDKFASCKADEDICGQPYPYGYPKEYCTKYGNIPQVCPHMCGKC